MNLTLGHARLALAKYVDRTGLNPADQRVVDRINEAQELLGVKGNAEQLLCTVRFYVYNGCVTLPREFDCILRYTIGGSEGRVWSKWYEFMSNGPGPLAARYDSAAYTDLQDRGMVCTQYDPWQPMKILVVSDRSEPTGSTIRIRGLDETGREVRDSAGIPGELVPVRADQCVYTNALFSEIHSIQKTPTAGYVTISGFNPTTAERFHYCTYAPSETDPTYRRYQVMKATSDQTGVVILALMRRKFIVLAHDTDPLFIQNLSATKAMLQALGHYDSGNERSGAECENRAIRRLQEWNAAQETNEREVDVEYFGSPGEIRNVLGGA